MFFNLIFLLVKKNFELLPTQKLLCYLPNATQKRLVDNLYNIS